jgi:hypothetical protein
MNDFEAWERIVDELGGPIMYILECGKRNNITLPNTDRLLLIGSVTTNAITDYHKGIIHQLNPNNGIKQLMNRYFLRCGVPGFIV